MIDKGTTDWILSTPEYKITTLLSERDSILKSYEESWNIETGYEIDEPKEIDELAEEVRSIIIDKQDCLEVDFMIESLTKLGGSPNILNDDSGNFAVVGCGFQSVSTDDVSDVSMSFFVIKEHWFKTIREALKYYLSE